MAFATLSSMTPANTPQALGATRTVSCTTRTRPYAALALLRMQLLNVSAVGGDSTDKILHYNIMTYQCT